MKRERKELLLSIWYIIRLAGWYSIRLAIAAEKPLTIIDTKKYYDNFLEYLKKDHIRSNPRHNHVKKTLEQLIKPGSKVLDIGCGTGISSYYMASKGAIVTAVDLSNKLIEFAKQNSFHENVTYIVADATKLKHDKRFDIITIIDSMEHIPKDNIMDFFNVIERHSLNQTIIYLNIPDGKYQRFIKNNLFKILF